jgi:hypothetical protein
MFDMFVVETSIKPPDRGWAAANWRHTMATAKTTTKKTTAKKTTAKKTTATRPAAKKTAAKKVTTKRPGFEMPEMPKIDEINDRVDDIATDVVKFVRDAAHTYIGVGLVVQDRIARRDASTTTYAKFLEEAKTKGHTRMNEIQDRFEPYVQRVTDRVEPVVERVEARLPEQVKEVIDTSRERMRHVLAA